MFSVFFTSKPQQGSAAKLNLTAGVLSMESPLGFPWGVAWGVLLYLGKARHNTYYTYLSLGSLVDSQCKSLVLLCFVRYMSSHMMSSVFPNPSRSLEVEIVPREVADAAPTITGVFAPPKAPPSSERSNPSCHAVVFTLNMVKLAAMDVKKKTPLI